MSTLILLFEQMCLHKKKRIKPKTYNLLQLLIYSLSTKKTYLINLRIYIINPMPPPSQFLNIH